MKPLEAHDPTRIGPYTTVARLGAGGMGVVYLATSPDGLVAVKTISPALLHEPAARMRFTTELHAASRLSSRFCVEVLSVNLDGPQPHLASRYLDGHTVAQTVRRFGPLRGGALITLAAGIAAALTDIHNSAVVHGDLAPGNVLLTDHGPVLIDFGLAQLTDVAVNIERRGTPGFAAPERHAGLPPARPADVYGWAATVTYAATGREPGDAVAVDDRLDQLLHNALSPDPAARPTAEDLLTRLLPLLPPASAQPAASGHTTTAWIEPTVTAVHATRLATRTFRDPGTTTLIRDDATPPGHGAQRWADGPEGRRLTERHDALREQVAAVAVDLADDHRRLREFTRRHDALLGHLIAAVYEARARIARRDADRTGNADAQAAADAAEQRSQEARRIADEADPDAATAKTPPSAELKRLQREAMRRFHPDTSDDDRAHDFAARVNDAMDRRDAAAIRQLLDEWDRGAHASPTATNGPQALREAIVALQSELADLRRQRRLLRDGEKWLLLAEADRRAQTGGDLLDDMRADLEHLLEQLTAALVDGHAGPAPN